MAKPSTKKQSAVWKWTKRVLITLAILAFLVAFVGVPGLITYFITHAGTRPFELRLTDTPQTFEVPFEDVQFASYATEEQFATAAGNGIALDDMETAPKISGWYLPHDSAKAVIIYAHGLFRSRQEMLKRACEMWQRGYAGLLIDFRRHGKSSGEMTSMGYLEKFDILSALRYLKKERHVDTPIAVCSVSMGAAATLLAAQMTDEIDAVIAESSFLSFDNTITHHAKLLLSLPRFPFASTIILMTKAWVVFSGDEFDVKLAMHNITHTPVLIMACEKDTRMPLENVRSLYDACPSPNKEFVVIPDAPHGAAFRTHPELYVKTVTDFLERNLH